MQRQDALAHRRPFQLPSLGVEAVTSRKPHRHLATVAGEFWKMPSLQHTASSMFADLTSSNMLRCRHLVKLSGSKHGTCPASESLGQPPHTWAQYFPLATVIPTGQLALRW